MGGAAVCRPRWRRRRSDRAVVLVGVTRCLPCAVPDRDAGWGGGSATAGWSSLWMACVVTLVWLSEWENGRHVWPLPTVVEVGKGVVWVRGAFGGVVSDVVGVVDVLGFGESSDVHGPLVSRTV